MNFINGLKTFLQLYSLFLSWASRHTCPTLQTYCSCSLKSFIVSGDAEESSLWQATVMPFRILNTALETSHWQLLHSLRRAFRACWRSPVEPVKQVKTGSELTPCQHNPQPITPGEMRFNPYFLRKQSLLWASTTTASLCPPEQSCLCFQQC